MFPSEIDKQILECVATATLNAANDAKMTIINKLENDFAKFTKFNLVGEYDYHLVSSEDGEYVQSKDVKQLIEEIKLLKFEISRGQ